MHAISTLGDALVAVALAGTLFFAVPVAAARPRVALYLLLTVAPFAVVAPLLGRLLDGRSGAGRLALVAAMALRAALAALAVARTQSLLLYPLAFGLLVCSRAHGISRTAMVPELAGPAGEPDGPGPGRPGAGPDLVAVNGRMARVAALGGTAGALLGVGLDRLLGGGAVLWAAAIAFAAGGVLALGLPIAPAPAATRPGPASTAGPSGPAGRPGWPGRRGGSGWPGRPTPASGRWAGSRCSCWPSSCAARASGPPGSACSWPAWASAG